MEYLTPDVYVLEVPAGARPISAVGTSGAAFLGIAPKVDAPKMVPTLVTNWRTFCQKFVGPLDDPAKLPAPTDLVHAVRGFFENGGGRVFICAMSDIGDLPKALDALKAEDQVQIVAAPGCTDYAHYEALISHCALMGDRVAILDGPAQVEDLTSLTKVGSAAPKAAGKKGEAVAAAGEGVGPPRQKDGYASFFYPRIYALDPIDPKRPPVVVPPSGHIAGIYARTDATRGVHKAPANERIRGALGVTHKLDREQQKLLNPNGVNAIRSFSDEGILVWGARTVAPASSEYRYTNVRRLVNMIKESIQRATRWIVFEPNDHRLWGLIIRDLTAFLTLLWRDGALMGLTPDQAFFVKCDEETNPVEAINEGRLTVVIGICPSKPAEFIVFQISQEVAGAGAQGQ